MEALQKKVRIQNGVPIPPRSIKRQGRPVGNDNFSDLEVGQSFVEEGSAVYLGRLKDLVRKKNQRMKGVARFHWDYVDQRKNAIRVWRVE